MKLWGFQMKLFKNKIIASFLRVYLNIILMTCQWKTNNLNLLKEAMLKDRPIMLSCWHEHLIYLSCFLKNWERKIHVVSSTHSDSEILATILESWRFKLIKGSSTRGWLSVLKKIIINFKTKKSILAITHDGPKGPPKKSKPGALKIAIKHKVQIFGMRGEASSFWQLKTWDKTRLPKPFSIINIYFYPEYSGKDSVVQFNDYLNRAHK